ncbi:MAG: glycosyltransferase [Nitrospira sp.]|nr:glycosyltransferase [Nitrospira sp.]
MSSRSPKVSIGLPVYNGERYLAETIDSILAQTYTDFELIISDNCSTDGSREICRHYVERDSRVRFFPSDVNKGWAGNYRRVFELARGPYFRWAPSDDVFAPESVAACVEVLDAHPDAVLCYPKTILIDGTGSIIEPYEDNLNLRSDSPVVRFRMASDQIGLVNVIYGLMRTEQVRQTGLIRHYPGSDIIFLIELSLYGQFLEINRPLFFRRMHEQASSSMKSALPKLQAYLNPSRKGRFFAYYWQVFFDQVVAVLRGPLNVAERAQLLYFLVRRAISSRDVYLRELIGLAQSLLLRPRQS